MADPSVLLDEQQAHVHEKFPSSSWLSDEQHVRQFLLWATFYQRNPHRFCKHYLGINLYWYQAILLYFFFRCRLVVLIAARATAKSWLIAVYAVCRSILFPRSHIVITSGVKDQAGLMISEKIKQDLYDRSPMLRREIAKITNSQADMSVTFHNGSVIEVVVCSENALGHRSTVNVGEEAKKIKKSIMDRVISPFRIIRQVPFLQLPTYDGDTRFIEEPVEIFISSSIEETHWLYKTAKQAFDGMLRGDDTLFMATDYAITLRHNIRSRKQMIDDYHKFDRITWMVEYENQVLRENTKAFFTYDMVHECQVLKSPFYPRRHEDVINRVKNKYALPKQKGEIRLIASDIAFVDRAGNDRSCHSCIRLLPDADDRGQRIYKMQVPYLEASPGEELRQQAIRIQQLKADFDADYLVLDARNGGVGVYDLLARVLYDDRRNLEYPALTCMNDEAYANRINNPAAEACIYVITASAKLNSLIANNLKAAFVNHQIELLLPRDDGIAELRQLFPEYEKLTDPEAMMMFEKPYLETMLAIAEITNLQYEKAENTGLIKIKEQSGWCKDRYTSISYGCYFAEQLARDNLNDEEELIIETAPMLVSNLIL